MLKHMRTSIEISDAVLARARKTSKEQHVTLRQLAEEGLLLALEKRAGQGHRPGRLVTYGEPGQPFPNLDWEEIRGKVYPHDRG
jgi:hypothetical protein